MKNMSYWIDTAPEFNSKSAGDLPARADVVVIGGGFTGLSAALELAKKKAGVVLLEAGNIGGEASGKNGGQCNNGIAHDYQHLVNKMGEARARELYQSFNDAVDSIETIVREENIDCDFSRRGKIKLAGKPHHFDYLKKACSLLQSSVEPDAYLVSPDEVRAEIGADVFYGGMVMPHSAQLHVGKFAAGLAEAAQRHGARLFEQTPVTGLKRTGPRAYRITTPSGVIEADRVIVATGSSQIGPLGWFRRRMVNVGSFIIVTEPIPADQLAELLPKNRNYVTTRIIGNYFRTTPDQRLLFGGRARFAVSNLQEDQKSGEILRASLSKVFPSLAQVGFDYCWGGLVDMTPDRLPRAGEHDGLLYAMGFSGHGVQMSVQMGKILARMLDGDASINPCRGMKWRAIPAHFGGTWFLPFVGAYYRFQDSRT
jgi:glycine/D-amino acid oxidase-like deaminating enzyme